MPNAWSACCARWPRRSPTCRTRRRCWRAPARTRPICWCRSPPIAAWPARSTPISAAHTRTLARRLEAEGKTVKILAVGRKGRDYLRRELASRIAGDISYAGKRRIEFSDAEDVGSRITAMLDGRRDRRLHPDLQPLPLGDLPDRHRAAADPGAAAAGRRRRSISAARPTSSSRTRRPSWRACCRRRWRSRSIARCWKAPPASTARA